MIDTGMFEETNKITDPVEAARKYLQAIGRFRDNMDTNANEIIFDHLAYHFAEKWARLIVELSSKD
jgi:hypothetical protein